MPGGDKTGPNGEGPMTGRQMGVCGQRRNQAYGNEQTYYAGQGMGCRRGFGRGRGNRGGRGGGRGFGRNY